MNHRLTTFTTIALASFIALSPPLRAQDSDRGEGDAAQWAQYGSVTPNEVFSVVTRLGDALLVVPQIHEGSTFQKIQALEAKQYSNKTPEDVFVRAQRLGQLVDQLRKNSDLGSIPQVTRKTDRAVPAEVYLSVANCLDGLVELVARGSQGQSWGALQQRTTFTDKTPSDVYGRIELAIERLELHLDVPSSALANVDPAPLNTNQTRSVRRTTQSNGVNVVPRRSVRSTLVHTPVPNTPRSVAARTHQLPRTAQAHSDSYGQQALSTSVQIPQTSVRTATFARRPAPTQGSALQTRTRSSRQSQLAARAAIASATTTVPQTKPIARTQSTPPPRRVAMTKPSTAAAAPATIPSPKPSAATQAGASNGELKRPGYKFLRQNESWSALKDASDAQKTDWWDAIKYVPLNKDGDIWASFGGHMRLRLEDWSDFAFGAPAVADDTFLLWRLMLHSDIHFGDNVRAYVEGKSALATDRELPGGRRAALDSDSLALQQGFVDLKIPTGDSSVTLRAGRQMFLFGKQRLVSPLPWANNLRAWDGVSAIANIGGWNVHGFYTQFVPVRKHDFNQADAQTEFFGFYATRKILDDKVGIDAYFLGLDKEGPVTFNGTAGPEERYTLGGRVFGQFADTKFDYDVEGAYQFGEVGAGDIAAYMFASEVGYKLADGWGAPRFKIGFDYASGDETAGGDVETFNQLFPLGHAYFGYMDFVARQNVIDISPGVSLKPMDKMTLAATGHLFWRADDADALYNAGGGVVRGGALGVEDEIGSEIDLILKYKFNRHLLGVLGYSHFFAGDFLEESGASEDMDFVYVQLQYTF